MEKRTMTHTADSVNDVQGAVTRLIQEGYSRDQIYVLAHDGKTTDSIADRTNTATIGTNEEGVMNTISNVFRSNGDKLRAKIRSLDVSESEADRLEGELDRGKIVILASKDV